MGRLRALIVKEFLAILRDPRGRVILIVPPLVQLLIFSFAATLDVTNAPLAVLNRDAGPWGTELVARITAAPVTGRVLRAGSPAGLERAIEDQQALAAISIGPDFSRDIAAGRPAEVQVILDGRRSNAAQVVYGDLGRIVAALAAETPAGGKAAGRAVTIVPQSWFNPALSSQWSMVPGLIGIIALLTGLVVTALSVARERETGTFDQLMVSPLRPAEILVGKAVPPLLIGLAQITLFLAVALWGFRIPFTGSLAGLYLAALVYLLAVIGMGLFISALSSTQQQAILGAFLLMVPMILLSGFATPVDNMPAWLQPLTLADPLRHFLTVIRGVFLRAMPLGAVAAHVWPLALIAAVTLPAAALAFRRRQD